MVYQPKTAMVDFFPFVFSHNLPEASPSHRPLFASLALFHFVLKISITGGSRPRPRPRPRPLATSHVSVALETKIKLGNSGNLEATGVPTVVPDHVAHELLQGGRRYLDVRTPEEFVTGHALVAVGSGMTKTPHFLAEVSKYFRKEDEVIVGSLSGKRWMIAATDLLASVYGEEEWSFGCCKQGTWVFSCPSAKNPMNTYREKIVLGTTNCSNFKVNQILRELIREWPGSSYDLLSENCTHFCDEFCDRLAVPKLLGWVNRFAHAGDAAKNLSLFFSGNPPTCRQLCSHRRICFWIFAWIHIFGKPPV